MTVVRRFWSLTSAKKGVLNAGAPFSVPLPVRSVTSSAKNGKALLCPGGGSLGPFAAISGASTLHLPGPALAHLHAPRFRFVSSVMFRPESFRESPASRTTNAGGGDATESVRVTAGHREVHGFANRARCFAAFSIPDRAARAVLLVQHGEVLHLLRFEFEESAVSVLPGRLTSRRRTMALLPYGP